MGKIFRSKQADGLSSECKEEGSSHFHGLKNDPNTNGIEPTGNECPRQKSEKGMPARNTESSLPQ